MPRPSAVSGEISMVNNIEAVLQDLDKKQGKDGDHRKRKNNKVRRQRSLVEQIFFPTNKTMVALSLGTFMIFVLLLFSGNKGNQNMGEKQWGDLLENVRGNDYRLFRWDATPLTIQRRGHGGCSKLIEASNVLMDSSSSITLKTIVAEFLTFCLTDAPTQRVRFSKQEGIHDAVIHMLKSKDSKASAVAAHLIYTSAFSNPKNHQTYATQGAVEALSRVIMDKNSITSQIMWAAAALQNLAASYCATADDGRCYWEWTLEERHVVMEEGSLPLLSDGSRVREEMLRMEGLVETLIRMACTGPVQGTFRPDNIFPGENARVGRDDNNPHVIAWAATGALKNLALEPSAKSRIEPIFPCLCRLKDSPDWLEQHKSQDLILFLRRQANPCIHDSNDDMGALCIDSNFVDQEHYHCDGYHRPTKEECKNQCVVSAITAAEACCECGGGTKFTTRAVLES